MEMLAANLLRMKRLLTELLRIAYADKTGNDVIDIHPIISPASRLQRFAGNDEKSCVGSALTRPHQRRSQISVPGLEQVITLSGR